MKKLYPFIILAFLFMLYMPSKATTWIITSPGNTFSPSTITITLGDTILFNINGSHNVVEVSQATWNANGNVSNFGFSLPFGGGMLIPTFVNTYYYVCQPHAFMGMKGQIIVNPSTGIPAVSDKDRLLKFLPNPTSTQTRVHTGIPDGLSNNLTVFDITGKVVMTTENILNNHLLDVAFLRKGIYFVEFQAEGYRRTSKLVISN